MCGMNHTCGSIILIKLLEGAYPKLNLLLFSPFVILWLVDDILDQREQPLRYLRAVFIGHHYLRTHICFANLVIVVREQVIWDLEIKCHNLPFL